MSRENETKFVDSEMIGTTKISRSNSNKSRFGLVFSDGRMLGVNADQWEMLKSNIEAIDSYLAKHNIKKIASKRALLKAMEDVKPEELAAALELIRQQKAG